MRCSQEGLAVRRICRAHCYPAAGLSHRFARSPVDALIDLVVCIDGIAKHPSNNWSGEVSVLVLGLDLEAAKTLARHYEQYAFVWASVDGMPELVQP